MISRLALSKKQWDEMRTHVARQIPLEACGLLAGKNDQVEKVLLVRNQAQSPVRYVMDPYEQLKAFSWIESHDLDLLGIFHSHPTGPETVSATDIAEAAYEVVHLIWSLSGSIWKARGFFIENGQALDVPLVIKEW
jgi:[CysO sulfur-carrier protein]-S-L-cysteine hydrolase